MSTKQHKLGFALAVAACITMGSGQATALRSDATYSAPLREALAGQAAAAECRLPEGKTGVVASYFYYWYDLPGGVHSNYLTQRPADVNASYKNVDWFDKQLGDMDAAGIDIALAVYWGEAEPSSDVGLANMGQAAANRSAAGKGSPKVGMFLDTGTIGQWPMAQRDLTQATNQAKVYQMVRKFYSTLPRQQWAAIEGRPVVWFWGAYFDIKANASFTEYLKSQFAAEFGVTPLLVADYSWQAPAAGNAPFDNYYAWGTSGRGYQHTPDTIASVGPGYDERLLMGESRTGRMTDREGGRYYQRNLEYALESDKHILTIETWNEFHEASAIADSVEEGRFYIDLTRAYTDRFKCIAHGPSLPLPPTATATGAPPTATATGAPPTATATSAPPTATATSVPPTATATSAPPTSTATSAPPTATATSAPPTNTPVPGAIHVGDLDGASIQRTRGNWQAIVAVYVHSSSESPVAGATVAGRFVNIGTASCTKTNGSGVATCTSPLTRNGSAAFEVTNVTVNGASYSQSNNHDTEGDSNGTTIVVAK